MTDELTEAVVIEQCDRDAAADFLESWEPGPEMTVVKLAMAFARHRAAAIAAVRAYDAAQGYRLVKGDPVAWRYHYPGELEHGLERFQSYEGYSCVEEDHGMIETPLFAAINGGEREG